MNKAKLDSLRGFGIGCECSRCSTKRERQKIRKKGRLREKRLWKKLLDIDAL